MELIFRILKAIVFGLVLLFSLRSLDFTWGVAATTAVIPIFLIASGVFARWAMMFVALSLILAAGAGFWRDFSQRPEVSQAAEATKKSVAEAASDTSAVLKSTANMAGNGANK